MICEIILFFLLATTEAGAINCDNKPEVLLAGSRASTLLDSSNPTGTHANLYCLTDYGQSAVPYPVTCSSSGTWQLDQKLNCPYYCGCKSKLFTSNGNFNVPYNVLEVRVVAIGGGGGGTNGHQPGGGGGYVSCGTFKVTQGETIQVVVGTGGHGAFVSIGTNFNNHVAGRTDGLTSIFGTFLSASGGKGCTEIIGIDQGVGDINIGCPGGSGSGVNCLNRCKDGYPGKGGSGGSNGGSNSDNKPGGAGQGKESYSKCLNLAVHHKLTAGDGGIGQQLYELYGASGGGGGVLVDGIGPYTPAGNGQAQAPYFGYGGLGYGAGGGGGGYSGNGGDHIGFRYGGGNGADGFVYVEWD